MYEESMKRVISYKIEVCKGEQKERILAWVLTGVPCGVVAGVTVPVRHSSLQGLNLSQVLMEGEARLPYLLARRGPQGREGVVRLRGRPQSEVGKWSHSPLHFSLHIAAVPKSHLFP